MVYVLLDMNLNFLLHFMYASLAGREIVHFVPEVGSLSLLTPSVINTAKRSFTAAANYFIMSSVIFWLNQKQWQRVNKSFVPLQR